MNATTTTNTTTIALDGFTVALAGNNFTITQDAATAIAPIAFERAHLPAFLQALLVTYGQFAPTAAGEPLPLQLQRTGAGLRLATAEAELTLPGRQMDAFLGALLRLAVNNEPHPVEN